MNTEDTLSGFQEFFHQPIIKDRSNTEFLLIWGSVAIIKHDIGDFEKIESNIEIFMQYHNKPMTKPTKDSRKSTKGLFLSIMIMYK